MPLAEKELETLLWEHPLDCQRRGLAIYQDFFATGRRYRHLALGPYGTAQLVNVHFTADNHCYYVQVISFCTSAITLVAYQKAKRHLVALRQTLERTLKSQGISATFFLESVLIGQRLQLTGNLAYLLNLDTSCQAYTYRYGVDGVHFDNVGKQWHITGSDQAPPLLLLGTDLLNERARALGASAPARTKWLASAAAERGELTAGLVITTEGIIVSGELKGEGEAHE